jgi:cytochrome c oxidase assembly protein subunit 15
VTGIIPPLNEANWQVLFEKYQSSPEFQKLHNHFTLVEFKRIFWMEFMHRILGRITGLIILVPGLWFYLKGSFRSNAPYITMMFLVAFQGFIGWWMVKSGLVDNPHVSHFRLAIHLITALILYAIILWEILVVQEIAGFDARKTGSSTYVAIITLILTYIQICFGAFVAGLDAGMIYNTFPLMGDRMIPSELYQADIMYDPASIQFIHRSLGYIVVISSIILAYCIRELSIRAALALLCAVSAQFLLGVLTVIYVVPMKLALAHQLFAVLLLSIIIYVLYKTRR